MTRHYVCTTAEVEVDVTDQVLERARDVAAAYRSPPASVQWTTVRVMRALSIKELLACLCEHIGDDVLTREVRNCLGDLEEQEAEAAAEPEVCCDCLRPILDRSEP